MKRQAKALLVLVLLMTVAVAACKGKAKPPVARPMPPPVTNTNTPPPAPPEPPRPVSEPIPVPAMPEPDSITNTSVDDLNRNSPLSPLFFELDSADVSTDGQRVLQANAAVLKKYPTMQVTIEGHCDERGTEEYNRSLGERRALALREQLVSLGIDAGRVDTVSYGKDKPADPGHDENAWRQNRRGEFALETPPK